jgi:hypothetical protein
VPLQFSLATVSVISSLGQVTVHIKILELSSCSQYVSKSQPVKVSGVVCKPIKDRPGAIHDMLYTSTPEIMGMAREKVASDAPVIYTMALFIRLIIRLFQLVFSIGTIFFSHNKSANSVFQPAYQHS